MRVRLKVFASLTRYVAGAMAGVPLDINLDGSMTLEDLVHKLNLPCHGVKLVFVNGRVQPLSYSLNDGDEVGIFPPVGGG